MQKKTLNYRIIIEPEKSAKGTLYNAYCPTLGLADYGHSIDKAIKNMRSLIKFHIESLLKDRREMPRENTIEELITSTRVSIERTGKRSHVLVG